MGQRFILGVALCLVVFMWDGGHNCQAARDWTTPSADSANSNSTDKIGVLHDVKWTAKSGAVGVRVISTGSRAFVFDNGILTAYDQDRGSILWTSSLDPASHDMYVTGLSLYRKVLYVGLASSEQGELLSFQMDTGKPRSVVSTSPGSMAPILSPPAFWNDSVIVREGNQVCSYGIEDGKLRWRQQFPASYGQIVLPSSHPVVSDGKVYFNSDLGIAFALDAGTGRTVWKFASDGYSSISAGAISKTTLRITYCAPIRINHVLLIADDSTIFGLDTTTGMNLWKVKLGHTFSFASVEGRAFAATTTGFYELDPSTGQIMRSRTVPDGIWACAVSKDRAILTHDPITTGGWEILDLRTWSPTYVDWVFRPDPVLAVSDGMLFLVGSNQPATEANIERGFRAYKLGK